MAQHIEYYVTQKKNEAVLHVLVCNTFQDIKGKKQDAKVYVVYYHFY